jgi:mannose-6-phosphate isomerase-like protein (cupin superfamily)
MTDAAAITVMGMKDSVVVVEPDMGDRFAAAGDIYTIKVGAEQTDGRYALIEAIVPPRSGPPPHLHTREIEAFWVLEGEITFMTADRMIPAAKGSFVYVPVGVPHAFRNLSDAPARMLILASPAGFDLFIREIGKSQPSDGPLPGPPTPAEIKKLVSIAPRFGIELLPPDTVRSP